MIKKIALFCSMVVVAVIANYYALQKFSARFSEQNLEKIPAKYTAIVFGAGLRKDSTPTSILADRLDAGIALYQAGKAKKILVSGDNRRHGYDEPEAMKRYLLEKGIPPQDIFLDYAGFDTYSTLYRAHKVFQVQDAILVSQQYHLDRALYIGKHLSMDVVGFPSDQRKYSKAIVYHAREMASRAKAQLDLLRHRKPHFLGDAIDIHGPSNALDKENSLK